MNEAKQPQEFLSLLEGSTVNTKHGPIRTDHILFVCSGAFHKSSPSDLLPELQGRLPVRVELKTLTLEDLKRILSEKKFNILEQTTALLSAEGLTVEFTPRFVLILNILQHAYLIVSQCGR